MTNIEAGLLYPFDEKKSDEEKKQGKDVSIGLDAESLFNYINVLEIAGQYNHTHVIHQLKQDLMLLTGRLQFQPDEIKKGDEDGRQR